MTFRTVSGPALLGVMALLVVGGCQTPPELAPRQPWYETETDLLKKEALLERQTVALIDSSGLLMYRAIAPLEDEDNWLQSHDIADAPAWQGYLMASAALKEAVSGEDQDALIDRLARGLEEYFRITGVEGLFGRSHIAGYKGPRKWWMEDKDKRPTKYWLRGPTGEWWRNGLAKGHLTLATFGCAVPLALEKRGELTLEATTRERLKHILLAAVRRLVKNDFQIVDFDGEPTEFGNLGPMVANGFNMMLVLHMLISAGQHDPELMKLYDEKGLDWADEMGLSLEGLGEIVLAAGHSNFDKPSYSDMQLISLAGFSIMLQETRRPYLKDVHKGLRGLWEYVRYERNAPFTLVYNGQVRPRSEMERVEEILVDLRDFPDDKRPPYVDHIDTDEVQPLCNRPYNTVYWKSSPYRKAGNTPGKPSNFVLGGQDYLLAYWLGRYLKLLPER